MLYAVYVSLVIVGFLTNLNGFLHGSKTRAVDAVLSIALVGLLIAAFGLGGWKVGIVTLVGTFVVATLTRPLAAAVATRLFGAGREDGGLPRSYSGLPPAPIQRLSEALGRPIDISDVSAVTGGLTSKKHLLEELFAYCESHDPTAVAIGELGLTRTDLHSLYSRLVSIGGCGQWICGHWAAASVFAFPHTLRHVATAPADTFEMACCDVMEHFRRATPLPE